MSRSLETHALYAPALRPASRREDLEPHNVSIVSHISPLSLPSQKSIFCISLPKTKVLGPGDRCDGGSDDEDEEDDETSKSRSRSRSRSRRRRGKGHSSVRGAREREAYGKLDEVELECQDGLVCMDVGGDRKECQPENAEGMEHNLPLQDTVPKVMSFMQDHV